MSAAVQSHLYTKTNFKMSQLKVSFHPRRKVKKVAYVLGWAFAHVGFFV